MPKLILSIAIIFISFLSTSQSLYFPPIAGTTWDTISPSTLGWCPDRIDSLYNYLEGANSKAFIVLKDGKIVLEKYFGTFTKDSVWYWASAGKTITSFMTGIAQQENYLSINDKTSQYLGLGWTDCTLAQENNITIKNQLTMTSGLDDGVTDNHCTIDTCLKYKANAATRWAYHNGPYTLLDDVISSATGQTLNSYINQKLKIPTGMTGLFIQPSFDNVFWSTPRSMARFGLLILNKGKWNATTIMSDTNYFNQMTNASQQLNKSYGYLWWLNGKYSFMAPSSQLVFPSMIAPAAPTDMFAAIGKNGQLINVVPSQNLVFIRMGNSTDGGEVSFLLNDTIWQKMNCLVCNPASTNTEYTKNNIVIYPNPTNESIAIKYENNYFNLELFDIIGNKITSKSSCFSIENVSTKDYKNGIYFLQISNEKKVISYQKIIICH
jgi:CubicO group peptidase (beta-lactamase class C family)